MPGSSWALTTLGTLCEQTGGTLQTGPFGSQLHAHDYQKHGEVPVVPTSAIGRRRLLDENVERIGREKANELARHYLKPGDILFARRGAQATGLSALVEERHDGWLCGTGAIRLRLNPDQTDPDFISFVLSSEATNRWIRQHAIGATMPNLNESVIRGIPIYLPALREQRAIASLLGSLDSKIELNRRLSETLEELAQTTFQSWFGSFSGDSEATPTERNWPMTVLGDHVTLQRGTTYSGQLVGLPGPALLGLGSIEPGGGFREGHYKTYGGECPEKLMLFPGDLFVALKGATKDGTMVGSIARVPPSVPSGRLTQDTVKLEMKPQTLGFDRYLYRLLLTAHYRQYCAGRITGSAQVGLAREDFLNYPVPLPPEKLLERFSEVDSALCVRQNAASAESKTLAELRDHLLPKLISGELRVPTAEKMVEAAL